MYFKHQPPRNKGLKIAGLASKRYSENSQKSNQIFIWAISLQSLVSMGCSSSDTLVSNAAEIMLQCVYSVEQ